MLNEQVLKAVNALALQWHASDPVVGFEAFRTWVLTTLKSAVDYDGAIWGLLPQGAREEDGVCGARLIGLPEAVLQTLTQSRRSEFSAALQPGVVSNVCAADHGWHSAAHDALQSHAQQHGMRNSLFVRFAETHAPGQQFVLLSRSAVERRFSADEAAQFEVLAPHMMLAYSNRRKIFLDTSRNKADRASVAAVAVIDRAGYVHDQHARFRPMFRREWSAWHGDRLPEPLLEIAARHPGARWSFRGEQIVADFVPVDDSYVVSARPRHPGDDLTGREVEVARRYASGGNFREVAESLNLAPATVRSHLRNVFAKLQIRNKAQLADLFR